MRGKDVMSRLTPLPGKRLNPPSRGDAVTIKTEKGDHPVS